jgi:hypothetical protein
LRINTYLATVFLRGQSLRNTGKSTWMPSTDSDTLGAYFFYDEPNRD